MENNDLQRTFILGDEWAYFKFYTEPIESDRILLDVIFLIKSELFRGNIIDKWFYIRYYDPDYHLRVRFHLVDKDSIGQLIAIVNKYLKTSLDDKYVWKVQTDVYVREVERYGLYTMEFSETVFFIQSELILDYFKFFNHNQNKPKFYWLGSFVMIDELLNILNFDMDEKCGLLNILTSSFLSEFHFTSEYTQKLSMKYRTIKKDIYEAINGILLPECHSSICDKTKVIKNLLEEQSFNT